MNDRANTSAEPARLLVARITALMAELHAGNGELAAAFRQAPSTECFDRATAFRTFPLEQEYRAAVERIENGSYGRCILCGATIEIGEMLESLLGRYCRRCLELRDTGSTSADSSVSSPRMQGIHGGSDER